MPPRMFLCPSCESHVKATETECPHCGVAFESVPRKSRTAAMVLLGLAAVAAPAACDSEVETSDDAGTPSQTASTTSMMMQSTTQDSIVSAYGVGGFSSTGGFGGEAGGAGGDGGDGGDAGGAGGTGGN